MEGGGNPSSKIGSDNKGKNEQTHQKNEKGEREHRSHPIKETASFNPRRERQVSGGRVEIFEWRGRRKDHTVNRDNQESGEALNRVRREYQKKGTIEGSSKIGKGGGNGGGGRGEKGGGGGGGRRGEKGSDGRDEGGGGRGRGGRGGGGGGGDRGSGGIGGGRGGGGGRRGGGGDGRGVGKQEEEGEDYNRGRGERGMRKDWKEGRGGGRGRRGGGEGGGGVRGRREEGGGGRGRRGQVRGGIGGGVREGREEGGGWGVRGGGGRGRVIERNVKGDENVRTSSITNSGFSNTLGFDQHSYCTSANEQPDQRQEEKIGSRAASAHSRFIGERGEGERGGRGGRERGGYVGRELIRGGGGGSRERGVFRGGGVGGARGGRRWKDYSERWPEKMEDDLDWRAERERERYEFGRRERRENLLKRTAEPNRREEESKSKDTSLSIVQSNVPEKTESKSASEAIPHVCMDTVTDGNELQPREETEGMQQRDIEEKEGRSGGGGGGGGGRDEEGGKGRKKSENGGRGGEGRNDRGWREGRRRSETEQRKDFISAPKRVPKKTKGLS